MRPTPLAWLAGSLTGLASLSVARAADLPTARPAWRIAAVAAFDGPMPTGVTVSRAGRIIVNFPRWGDPVEFIVAELGGDVMRNIPTSFAVVFLDGLTATESEGRTLSGHRGAVRSVAYSPKGGLLASGGDDRTLRLWDTEAGKAVAVLKGHEATVNSVAFSPDGSLVASGSDDRTVRLWDAGTGVLQRTLAREDIGPVRSVAFSPDGSRVASADYEPTVRLWDVRTGELRRTLFEPSNGMWSVAFSPDGKIVWSTSAGGWATAWDVATGREVRRIDGAGGNWSTLAVSPDGRWVATGRGVWDAETGAKRRAFQGSPVAFSPAGGTLAFGGITLLDLGTWAEKGSHPGHRGGTRCLAFSPDGKWLASGGADGTVKLWPQHWAK